MNFQQKYNQNWNEGDVSEQNNDDYNDVITEIGSSETVDAFNKSILWSQRNIYYINYVLNCENVRQCRKKNLIYCNLLII